METPPDSSTESKDFAWAWEQAKRVLKRRFRVLRLVREAYGKMGRHDDALRQVKDDLRTLLRLASAWARDEYRRVPWRAVVYVVGAIIYLLNPADAIPDVLAGIGFVDDVAVITMVVKALRNELDDFRAWESSQAGATEASPPPAPASLATETLDIDGEGQKEMT
jgi:uncharacterized membrane protein YkvA (DUF1232 family)